MTGSKDRDPAPPAIILVEPQLGENIGTAARAMGNFELDTLRLVDPREEWPNPKARSAASGADWIIDDATVHATFEDAIADLQFVVATTARPRDLAKPVMTPETLAAELHHRAARGERCGILFGKERIGLTNDHVALADAVVMAPVNPAFASLNLAQAVLLLGYEWLKQKTAAHDAGLGRMTPNHDPGIAGLHLRDSRPATREEWQGVFDHLERELDASGFLRPPEKRPAMVRNIRTMFTRMAASERELRTFRGIIASLSRAHEKGRRQP